LHILIKVKIELFCIGHIFQSAIRDFQLKRGWNLALCLLLLLFIQRSALAQPQPGDTLLFREGEILFSKGETEKALWRFKRLLSEFPNSPLYNEAKFRLGICYTQLKKPKEAIRTLNELLTTFLSPARMIQVFTLLGDNHLELKDLPNALHWYGKGLLIPGQTHEDLKRKLRSIIDAYDTEEELIQIESLYRGAYGGGYAKLKLAQMAKHRGNDNLAKKILFELEKEYRTMDYWSQAKDLSESIRPFGKSKYTVGVILPLSGIHQPFGERALQGIQLAMKEVDPQDKNPLISLTIRDSKGIPREAEKAVEDLAIREKAIAIIGPLLSTTVDKAAKKAQQLKVPLLTFSQKEPLYGMDEFVFQNSLTPSDQIQCLVAFAIRELELRTFAVFYPNSPYGLHFKSLFTQEVVRRGGKVLGVVAYQEDQTDFSQEIKGFFKIETIQKHDARRKKNEEFKLGLSVDGLFIPDTYDRVGLILSHMAYYDIKGLTFLGTNAWNGPGLISIAGKSAEGAIFVDAFFKKNPSPSVARFVEEFQKAYQREPDTLEALSYDGTKLLSETLLSKPVSSPLQLKEELRQIQNFQGVSGLKGYGEGGKAIRTLYILKVNKGQIEQIAP
jgi:ABC-type branched-subunit amino acid transport system substrate-binding protein